jgi:hypothetical protein
VRILVLTTSARIDAAWVDELVTALPAVDELALSVVAVTPPRGRLPVDRCLVVGPFLRPGRPVREVRVAGGPRVPGVGRRARLARKLDRRLVRLLPARWSGDRARMLETGVRRSRVVHEEVERADIVVAHDFNTTWAAWRLARRIPGPAVVFQPEGVALKLAEQDEAAPH